MKKLLAITLSLLLVVAAFAGCGANKETVSSALQKAASATIRTMLMVFCRIWRSWVLL